MIAKVIRGWRPAGLIAYLMGPGQHEEHRNPRIVASFDGAPAFHQPPKTGSGEFDFDLRALIGVMQELPREFGLPLDNPAPMPDGLPSAEEWTAWLRTAGKRKPPAHAPDWVKHYHYDTKAREIVLKPGYVWHCPVRLHPDDPALSDEQWERIAQRLMEATGIHQSGCRWIAVRHADDHVHLMATLVTVDGKLKRFHPRNDWDRLRETCQELERELGLTPTPDIDRTASKLPTRGEIGKAARLGRSDTARSELRRLVSQAAAGTYGPDDFFAKLHDLQVQCRTSHGANGGIRGCAFALPTNRTRGREMVWFGGGKLAADLTWPALLSRWDGVPANNEPIERNDDGRSTPAARRHVLEQAAAVVNAAAAQIHAEQEDPDGIAHAAGEVLGTLALANEYRTPGPLTTALDRYDRAARSPHRVLPRDPGPLARELRWVARRLAAVGSITGRFNEKVAFAALVLALAGLIAEIRAWLIAKARVHQAAAAGHAIAALPADPATAGRPAVRLGQQLSTQPTVNHETRRRRPADAHPAILRALTAQTPTTTGRRTR